MAIALTAIPRFPFTNFSIRYMILLKDSDTRRILNFVKIITEFHFNFNFNNSVI